VLYNTEVKERNSTICRHACFGVLRLISAAWYTSRHAMAFVLIYMTLALPSACGITRAINASRHAQSDMGPECSNNHEGSELCIIANGHPINSTECSTTPKWRGVIVQSADMHVSASYASSVQLGTHLDTQWPSYWYTWHLLSQAHVV
jgi:hypothetical protein